jgi:hypothetical protein
MEILSMEMAEALHAL